MQNKKDKKKLFSFQLIVIGAGGTGTYFLKEASRYLAGLSKRGVESFSIYDGDNVESKNLDRQCFQEEDVGQNKACVMAEILSENFCIPWTSYPIYIEKKEDIRIRKDTVPIIIGAVDNHACRMVLESLFASLQNVFYLDSANEYTSGEVIFSGKINGKVLAPLRSFYFPDIKNSGKSRTEMSCSELNQSDPQHICTNMAAGNILLRELASLRDGIFHGGMVCFDTERYYQEYIPANTEKL